MTVTLCAWGAAVRCDGQPPNKVVATLAMANFIQERGVNKVQHVMNTAYDKNKDNIYDVAIVATAAFGNIKTSTKLPTECDVRKIAVPVAQAGPTDGIINNTDASIIFATFEVDDSEEQDRQGVFGRITLGDGSVVTGADAIIKAVLRLKHNSIHSKVAFSKITDDRVGKANSVQVMPGWLRCALDGEIAAIRSMIPYFAATQGTKILQWQRPAIACHDAPEGWVFVASDKIESLYEHLSTTTMFQSAKVTIASATKYFSESVVMAAETASDFQRYAEYVATRPLYKFGRGTFINSAEEFKAEVHAIEFPDSDASENSAERVWLSETAWRAVRPEEMETRKRRFVTTFNATFGTLVGTSKAATPVSLLSEASNSASTPIPPIFAEESSTITSVLHESVAPMAAAQPTEPSPATTTMAPAETDAGEMEADSSAEHTGFVMAQGIRPTVYSQSNTIGFSRRQKLESSQARSAEEDDDGNGDNGYAPNSPIYQPSSPVRSEASPIYGVHTAPASTPEVSNSVTAGGAMDEGVQHRMLGGDNQRCK